MANNDRASQWTALSIQDRIRAMNETLDTVDQQTPASAPLVETVGEESSSNTIQGSSSVREQEATQDFSAPPKRSSVVDIWRKREGAGGGKCATEPSGANPNSSGSSHQQQQESLTEVKTALSNKFGTEAATTNARSEKQLEETEEKPSQSRKWNQRRRIDSATPTPPPLPGSTRTPVPLKKPPDINEPADLTILPAASSSASSVTNGDQSPSSTSRSNRLVNMWGKLSGHKLAEPTKEGSSVVGEQNDQSEPADQNDTPLTAKRKSVVDIWKNRASPGSKQNVAKVPAVAVEPSSPSNRKASQDLKMSPPRAARANQEKPADWKNRASLGSLQKQVGDQVVIESSSSVSPAVTNRKSFESDISKQSFKASPVTSKANIKKSVEWQNRASLDSTQQAEDQIVIESLSVSPPAVTKRKSFESDASKQSFKTSPVSSRAHVQKHTDFSTEEANQAKRWPQPNQQNDDEADLMIVPPAQKVSPDSGTSAAPVRRTNSGKIADRWTQRMSDHWKTSPEKEESDLASQSEEFVTSPIPASPPRSGSKLVDRWTPMRHHSIGDSAVLQKRSPSRVKATNANMGSPDRLMGRSKEAEMGDAATSIKDTVSPRVKKEGDTDVQEGQMRSSGKISEKCDERGDIEPTVDKTAGEVDQQQKSRRGGKITDIWKNALKGNSSRNLDSVKSPAVSKQVVEPRDRNVKELQDDIPIAPPPLFKENSMADDVCSSPQNEKSTSVVASPGSVSENAFSDENNSREESQRGKISDRWNTSFSTKKKTAEQQKESFVSEGSPTEKTRGKVTDRWKHSGESTSKVHLQENAAVSALVKEHAVRTPTGQVRNKVSGRWNKRLNAEAPLASPSDSDRAEDHSLRTDNDLEKAGENILPHDDTLNKVQKESLKDSEGGKVVCTASQENGNGIRIQETCAPGPVDATVSSLVKDYAGRTPTGKRRNKVLDRWNKRMSSPNHDDDGEAVNGLDAAAVTSSPNFASVGTLKDLGEGIGDASSPASSVHEQNKVTGTDCWNNRDEEKKASPVPRLFVNDSVSELVKQHAAQTPFGQKRGRWNESDRSTSEKKEETAIEDAERSPVETCVGKLTTIDSGASGAADNVDKANAPDLYSATVDAKEKPETSRPSEEIRLDDSASCVDVSFTSPSDIIDAWTQHAAPTSSTTSTDAPRKSLLPSPKFRSARSEPGTNSKKGSDLTSSFTIIDAWSKKASPQNVNSSKSSKLHEHEEVVSEVEPPPMSPEADKQPVPENDTSGLSTQSSAFGPWKNSANSQSPERKLGGASKTRKNFMLLGRKHVVKRLPHKLGDATTDKGDKIVKASTAGKVEDSVEIKSSEVNLKGSSAESLDRAASENESGNDPEAQSHANRIEGENSSAKNVGTARERKSLLQPPSGRSKDPSARRHVSSGSVIAKSESYSLSEDFEARPRVTTPDNGSKIQPPQKYTSKSVSDSNVTPLSHTSRSPSPSLLIPADKPDGSIGSGPTTPTRKLSNEKKKLQLHRHRLSKKGGGGPDSEPHSGQDPENNGRLASEDKAMLALMLDPSPRAESASGHTQLGSHDSNAAHTNNAIMRNDQRNLLLAPQSNDSEVSRTSDADSAFAGLHSTASNLSSSSLAGRAEKVLQKRRRKGTTRQQNMAAASNEGRVCGQKESNLQMDPEPSLQKAESSQKADAHEEVNDQQSFDRSDRGEIFVSDERPRLSTRYNTSSRFVENSKGSGGGKKQFLKLTISHSTDSGESSHFSSVDAMTTDSESRYAFEKSESDASRGMISRRKRRNNPAKKSPKRLSMDEKSATIESTQSGCESVVSVKDVASDWVPASFDINKFTSAMDEKMTALRDYVGGTTKSKPPLKIPDCGKMNSLDVEDVAIEVEYVEEEEDDDDGLDSDNEDPREMIAEEFSATAKKETEDDFATAFTDMAVRHSGYV